MAQTAADIVARFDGQPFHLLGYSMGGRLALYIALHYPNSVASLILESASPGLADDAARQLRRQQDNALADRIERDGIVTFIEFWTQLSLWESQQQLPEKVRAALYQRRLQNDPIGLANSLRGMGTGVQPSLWSQLGTLQMPTHLIVGALDQKFVAIAHEMAAAMDAVRLDVVAGAGHTVHLERPLRFAEHITLFLEDHSEFPKF
jgi:2-succinyl-6-hydroxy-2,4-cyclohexadiene-1-carboxylate synthase